MKASVKPRSRACSSQIFSTTRQNPRHGSGSASPSSTMARQARTWSANASVTSICLVGKWRYRVAGPTPARRAISRIGTFSPSAANSARAASRMRSRLSRASERSGVRQSVGHRSHFSQADAGVR